MHLFRVWAPRAESVDLVLPTGPAPGAGDGGHDDVPMLPGDNGWWAVEVDEAGHGTDYAFSVDGGDPRPDPRSAWQPQGVHGPSRAFDAARFAWPREEAAGGWPGRDVLGSLFYELHVGTFTPEGTFDAALDRLDHLVDLGVDVVYNHLGPSGNYLAEYGPYFTHKHQTPWGAAVNLDDDGSLQVRRWICDNALRWFEDFHVDALRLDAVHALVDDSPRHVLAQLSDEVAELSHRLRRPLSLVAESDLNDPRMVEQTRSGGYGMTAQWSDDFHHALHALLTGEQQGYYVDFGSIEVLRRTLTTVFRHAGDFSTFRGADWGRPVDPARHRGHRFLGYLQDHDQVGNRAIGDRISATLSPGRLAAGAALVLTSPFTPMLFMGEEWGAGTPWQFFTDFGDPALAAAVREGRRGEFAEHGWIAEDVPDPQDPATREASVLDWSEPAKDGHARLLGWYRDLVALRRREPDLRDDDLSRMQVTVGGVEPAADGGGGDGDGWVVVRRGAFDVLVNLGTEPATLPADPRSTVVLAWDEVRPDGDGIVLGPDGAAVVRRPD